MELLIGGAIDLVRALAKLSDNVQANRRQCATLAHRAQLLLPALNEIRAKCKGTGANLSGDADRPRSQTDVSASSGGKHVHRGSQLHAKHQEQLRLLYESLNTQIVAD